MAKIKIVNNSKTNIGFSFGFIFRGKQLLVEESRLNASDKRMIAAKNLLVVKEGDPMPVSKPEPKKEPVKEEGKINVPENKGAPEKVDAVTPVPTPEPPKQSAPPVVESKPVPPEPTPAPQSEETSKPKLTSEQLEAMTKTELKELAKDLKVDKRSRKDMIAKILESQGA